MKATQNQLKIIRHATNLRQGDLTGLFVRGEGADDFNDCVILAEGGYMLDVGYDLFSNDIIFKVTDKGRELLRASEATE